MKYVSLILLLQMKELGFGVGNWLAQGHIGSRFDLDLIKKLMFLTDMLRHSVFSILN